MKEAVIVLLITSAALIYVSARLYRAGDICADGVQGRRPYYRPCAVSRRRQSIFSVRAARGSGPSVALHTAQARAEPKYLTCNLSGANHLLACRVPIFMRMFKRGADMYVSTTGSTLLEYFLDLCTYTRCTKVDDPLCVVHDITDISVY